MSVIGSNCTHHAGNGFRHIEARAHHRVAEVCEGWVHGFASATKSATISATSSEPI